MEMVETKALLENTPGSPTFKRRHIRFVLLGKSEIGSPTRFRFEEHSPWRLRPTPATGAFRGQRAYWTY